MVTGVAVPMLNGAWPERLELEPRVVSELLDKVADSALPYCLQLRPGAAAQLGELARQRGMVGHEPVHLMVLERRESLDPFQDVERLSIRQLSPDEALLHATVAAHGFEVPEEPLIQLVTPEVLALPEIRCYVGETEGEPVTTGIGVTLGPFVGLFNIATLPERRGRGFGAAVAARAAADGLDAGAEWSYLQSGPASYRLYERLGYRSLERWDCWLSPHRASPTTRIELHDRPAPAEQPGLSNRANTASSRA